MQNIHLREEKKTQTSFSRQPYKCEFSSYQLAHRGLCPHHSQLWGAAAEWYHIPWLYPPCSAMSNFFFFSLFLNVLRATAQDIKMGCQKWRMKQHKERVLFAAVRSPQRSEGRVGETLLYFFDSLQTFTVSSLNLPVPSGLSTTRDPFRAGHLKSMCFPPKKSLTIPPSPVQMLLPTWKQSPESLFWDICVVAATSDRERALGKTVLCSCGSHRAVQTLVKIRAVARALNFAFVYVSYLDLTAWGRKRHHLVL